MKGAVSALSHHQQRSRLGVEATPSRQHAAAKHALTTWFHCTHCDKSLQHNNTKHDDQNYASSLYAMLPLCMLCFLSLCYASSLYALALLHGDWQHFQLCFRRRRLGRLFAVGVLVLPRRCGIGCVSHLPWVCTSTMSCCDRNVTCIELQWTLFDMEDHVVVVVVVVTAPRFFPDRGGNERARRDEPNRIGPDRIGNLAAIRIVAASTLWLGSPSIDPPFDRRDGSWQKTMPMGVQPQRRQLTT